MPTDLQLDAFDRGAEAVWEAKAKGEKLFKSDLARIFRTTFQAFQISHPIQEVHPPKKKRTSRHPLSQQLPRATFNSLFDAFVLFENVNSSQLTANGRYKITEAVEQILAVCPDLNPEEINRRGNQYKKLYPNLTPTSMGLCSNWDKCGGGSRTQAAKLDPYREPLEWKSTALRMYPGTEVAVRDWFSLSTTVRTDILKQIP
jgi:hypothetical protein